MTNEQATLLKKVVTAIVDSVKEMGVQGAPAGQLYAALMATDISLEQFETIMGSLVRVKLLRKSGNLYFALSAAESSQAR